MDEGDGQGVRPRLNITTLELDVAAVGRVDAGENFDQRRLAGAVLAEKRMDLAASHIEIDAIECKRRGETLGQPTHDEE